MISTTRAGTPTIHRLDRWFLPSRSRASPSSLSDSTPCLVSSTVTIKQSLWASSLPHELISEILGFLTSSSSTSSVSFNFAEFEPFESSDVLAIFVFSKVCRLWRWVALTSPRFWARVTYQRPRLLDLFLSRSANHPLEIRGVKFEDGHANDLLSVFDMSSTFSVASIFALGPRVRSLQLDFGSVNVRQMKQLRDQFHLQQLTNLTALSIYACDLREVPDMLLLIPCLAVLRVGGGVSTGVVCDKKHVELILPQLRVLDYHVCHPSDGDDEFLFCLRGPAHPKTTITVHGWMGSDYLFSMVGPDINLKHPSRLPISHRWAALEAQALCIENCGDNVAFRVNAHPTSAADYDFRCPACQFISDPGADLNVVVESAVADGELIPAEFGNLLGRITPAYSFLNLTDLMCWGRDPLVSFAHRGVWDTLLPLMPSLRRIAIDISGVSASTAVDMDYSIFAALKPTPNNAEVRCPQLELIRVRAACLHEWDGMWFESDLTVDRERAYLKWGDILRKRTGQLPDPIGRNLKHVKMEVQPMWTVEDVLSCLKARRERDIPLKELEIWCGDSRLDGVFDDHRTALPKFVDKFSFVTDGYKAKKPRMHPLTHYFQPIHVSP